MGILGDVELVSRHREVMIGLDAGGREVYLKVRAPRLQLIPELRTSIPAPEPPPLRDSNGKIRYQTDPKTGEPIKKNGQLVPKLDFADKEYQVKVASVERARSIAMVFACTAFPGSSKLKEEDYPDSIAYWLARWGEAEEAGCDMGAFGALTDACGELSNPMSRGEIEDAREALGTDEETQSRVKAKLGSKAPEGK